MAMYPSVKVGGGTDETVSIIPIIKDSFYNSAYFGNWTNSSTQKVYQDTDGLWKARRTTGQWTTGGYLSGVNFTPYKKLKGRIRALSFSNQPMIVFELYGNEKIIRIDATILNQEFEFSTDISAITGTRNLSVEISPGVNTSYIEFAILELYFEL